MLYPHCSWMADCCHEVALTAYQNSQTKCLQAIAYNCAVILAGLLSTALVLSIALPFGGQNWYWLAALSPLSGAYYWQRGTREEEFRVSMLICWYYISHSWSRKCSLTADVIAHWGRWCSSVTSRILWKAIWDRWFLLLVAQFDLKLCEQRSPIAEILARGSLPPAGKDGDCWWWADNRYISGRWQGGDWENDQRATALGEGQSVCEGAFGEVVWEYCLGVLISSSR